MCRIKYKDFSVCVNEMQKRYRRNLRMVMPEVEEGIKLSKTKQLVAVLNNKSGVARTYFIDKNVRELQTKTNRVK